MESGSISFTTDLQELFQADEGITLPVSFADKFLPGATQELKAMGEKFTETISYEQIMLTDWADGLHEISLNGWCEFEKENGQYSFHNFGLDSDIKIPSDTLNDCVEDELLLEIAMNEMEDVDEGKIRY